MEMTQEEFMEKEKIVPPYIPLKTFTSLIERFRNTAVPSRIDSSVMPSTSGTMQSQLKSALRFLRLTDPDGHTTESLKSLVHSYNTDQWQRQLRDVISTSYAPIINGLDITAATSAQVKDRFRTPGGVEGATIEKSVRFYLAALQEAAIPFSPHLSGRRGRLAGNRRGPKRSNKVKPETQIEKPLLEEKQHERNPAQEHVSHPAGTVRFPVTIPEKPQAVIVVPEDLTQEEWSMIDGLLRSYIGLRHKSKQQPNSS